MSKPVAEARTTPLGRRVAKVRREAKIPARALSIAANASPAVVYQIERGIIVDPSAAVVCAIANALGTTAEWLISGVGDGPTPEAARRAFEVRVGLKDQPGA